MNTKQIGDKSEGLFLSWCLVNGLGVSVPYGDRLPYDFIVDINGSLIKIQVKTASRHHSGVISVPVCNTTTESGKWKNRTYVGKVDAIVACDHMNGYLYVIPIKEISGITRAVTLRTEPPSNMQRKNIRFANHYRLFRIDQLEDL